MKNRSIFSRMGPAFVAGACIIGPGSVTLMSKTGSLYGYSMLWVSILAGALTCGFIILFMRFGIYSDETFMDVTRRKVGWLFAVLCGLSLAATNTAFQFGNCLGVAAGMDMLFGKLPPLIWPILFTAAAITFMFTFKNIYKIIEKMMAVMMITMLVAFTLNLIYAKPDVVQILKGATIPTIPANVDWVTICGLIATTFCLSVVVFQAYAVKAKGWTEKNLADGITDTVAASIVLTLIGSVIMMTAAALLFTKGIKVNSAGAMAIQLEKVFGNFSKIVFGIGFTCAAFSSFLVNTLVGGTLINDGLKLGGKFDSKPTKIFATCVLLIGLSTSLVIINHSQKLKKAESQQLIASTEKAAIPQESAAPEKDPKVIAIAVGQGATLLAVPFGAIATVIVLFDKRHRKGKELSLGVKAFVLFGALVLLGITVMMYIKIRPAIADIFS